MKATMKYPNGATSSTEATIENGEMTFEHTETPSPEAVIANPTLEGTESALEGLQVGDTKYKVESGTKLYSHNCIIDGNGDNGLYIISTKREPYTASSGWIYMSDRDVVKMVVYDDSAGEDLNVLGFDFSDGTYQTPSGSPQIANYQFVADEVTEL